MWAKGHTKKFCNLYYIVDKEDIYLEVIKNNLTFQESEEYLEMYCLLFKINSLNMNEVDEKEVERKEGKIRVIKEEEDAKPKELYTKTYERNKNFKYDKERCRQHYLNNKEKRLEYSKNYYHGLKEKLKL